ncbi:hypothetical protein NDU88_006264 [Pleurodeles waltl]|uniref:Uncharacterized protein n=1 Tax=Pleurodeles waltl TaxID=8319 RepID=A0AAV7LNM0_PLEWA|nr:hypothetical protein NDU88_006264 [Pleurodeles waltl]
MSAGGGVPAPWTAAGETVSGEGQGEETTGMKRSPTGTKERKQRPNQQRGEGIEGEPPTPLPGRHRDRRGDGNLVFLQSSLRLRAHGHAKKRTEEPAQVLLQASLCLRTHGHVNKRTEELAQPNKGHDRKLIKPP